MIERDQGSTKQDSVGGKYLKMKGMQTWRSLKAEERG